MAFQDVGVRAVVQGLGQYMKDLDKIDTKTKGIGKAIVTGLAGAAVGGAVGILGQRFAKLDSTMAGVSARAGLTAKQTDNLTDSVIKLSKANLQSQEEIALTGEALISLQGISADNQEQIETLTQKYLDYSQVTGQTAPEAVAAFDDILDAWNLTAEEGVGIMDQLVVSHQKFGTDIVGAQSSLNKYASTFQTLGLDVNDALGYINLFAASGVDAESASTAFTKAVGLLTDGTDASNKKLADMASNLGLTNEQLEAFKNGDPAAQFDILTKAIANTEDPTLRAQAAIDLFGAKAGPKMAEALAGNGLAEFQVSVEDAAGASEEAADKIQGTLTNKLKLLGNEIIGRAQEITQDFAPALQLLSNPQITTALGGIVGAFAGMKVPDLSGFVNNIQTIGMLGGQGLGALGGVGGNIAQTITQNVVRVGNSVLDAGLNVAQKITQTITKVTVDPKAMPDVERAGKDAGTKFGTTFQDGVTSVFGTTFGTFLFKWIGEASFKGFAAGASRAGMIGVAVVLAAAFTAALYTAFRELDYSKTASAIMAGLGGMIGGIPLLIGAAAVRFAPAIGQAILDAIVSGITTVFTPEFIGARLADVVMLGLVTMFAPEILAIHFRQAIADMFEMIGRLVVDGATALPGLLAGLGTLFATTLINVLMTEIQFPVVGGVKVWEAITGILLPGPAAIYEFFKQGLAGPMASFFADLPGLALEGASKTGEALLTFFSVTLPDLMTREAFFALLDASRTFFGETLPEAIVEVIPAIPGAVLDGLVELPSLTLESLDLVTVTFTDWVTGLGDWVLSNFIPWNWIKAAAGGFVDEIEGWLALIWGSGLITEWVNNLANWLTTNFNPWTWVKAAFDLTKTEVENALGGLGTVFQEKGKAALDKLRFGMVDGIPALGVWLIGLPATLVGFLGDLATKFSDAGYNAAKGLATGLVKGIPDFVEGAVGKIADKADPRNWYSTPEEHYRMLFGNAAHGIAQELIAAVPEIMDAAGLVSRAATPAMAFGVGGGGPSGRNGDSGPGVRPASASAVPIVHSGEGVPISTIGDAFDTPRLTREGIIVQQILDNISGNINAAVAQWNALPQNMRDSLGESTSILQAFGNAGVMVFDDLSVRTQQTQDALDRVASGTSVLTDALVLGRAGFTDLAAAVLQFNAGMITADQLAAMVGETLDGTNDAVLTALENYDFLASMLDKAKDKNIELTDALAFQEAGYDTLASAVLAYNANLITADELTQTIKNTFTEVATSAEVLGAQWTTAFADSLARQDLLEKVGSAGVRVLDQLNTVLTEGGAENVQALADMVVQMQEQLSDKLPADEAEALGEAITDALQTALEEGTPEAVKALTDLLDAANDAMEEGTTQVLSTVDKFNKKLGEKLADKALEEKVGKNGADLMDALDTAIETGGKKGVDTMAQEAFDIIEAMDKELAPAQADYLGDTLMAALQTALEDGGEGAVAAVMAILTQIQNLIDGAPKTIPAPVMETPKTSTPRKPGSGPSGHDEDSGAGGDAKPSRNRGAYFADLLQRTLGLDASAGADRLIGTFNATFGSNSALAAMWKKLIDANVEAAKVINWAEFKNYMKGFGHVAFAKGGIVTKPTMGLVGEAGPEAIIPLRGAGQFVLKYLQGVLKGDTRNDWLSRMPTQMAGAFSQYFQFLTLSGNLANSTANKWLALIPEIYRGATAAIGKVFLDNAKADSPGGVMAGSTAGGSGSVMTKPGSGASINVSPTVQFYVTSIDWNRVKQIARDTVDDALGKAKSQYERSGVRLTDGVG